ncbi:MAG: MFS transporter [Acidimicrobiia bacterium]|nr:MFS transporter [Acidimicrobiia bacterium]
MTLTRTAQSTGTRFFGWRMVIIAIIAGSLTGPGQTVGVSVFVDYFVADLGLTQTGVSFAYLIGTLLGATAMPFVGQRIDDHGVRTAMLVVASLFGLALLNMSLVQNWLWLAAGFVFIRMLGQGSLSMISSVTVAVWFDRLRGRAIGLTTVGVAAGIATTPIVLNSAINRYGWRQAWVLAAVAVPTILLPLGWFGLISRPSDVGQVPDGHPSDQTLDLDNPLHEAVWGYTRSQALAHPGFWLILAVTTLTSMLVTGLNFHAIDLLVQNGLTKDEAAQMFLPQIAGSTAAALGLGWVVDRTNGRALPAVSMTLLAGSHYLAASLNSPLLVVTYALSLGVTAGCSRVVSSALMPKWFGISHIGSLNGLVTFVSVAGSALGPITLSLTRDQLGSYSSAAIALASLPLAATLYAVFVRPPTSRPSITQPSTV